MQAKNDRSEKKCVSCIAFVCAVHVRCKKYETKIKRKKYVAMKNMFIQNMEASEILYTTTVVKSIKMNWIDVNIWSAGVMAAVSCSYGNRLQHGASYSSSPAYTCTEHYTQEWKNKNNNIHTMIVRWNNQYDSICLHSKKHICWVL